MFLSSVRSVPSALPSASTPFLLVLLNHFPFLLSKYMFIGVEVLLKLLRCRPTRLVYLAVLRPEMKKSSSRNLQKVQKVQTESGQSYLQWSILSPIGDKIDHSPFEQISVFL